MLVSRRKFDWYFWQTYVFVKYAIATKNIDMKKVPFVVSDVV